MTLIDALKWFKHASFGVEDSQGQKYFFIDPFDLKGNNYIKADYVFITHIHYDHCSEKDFKKIAKRDAIVVAPKACLDKLKIKNENRIEVKPFEKKEINGLNFSTIPAYNVNPERLKWHPRSNNWVGYIIELGEGTFYHAGDTDFIPEMKELKNIDLALLPMGGTYTMNTQDAVNAANVINARLTAPIHYKTLLKEKSEDAEKEFCEKIKGKTIILKEFL